MNNKALIIGVVIVIILGIIFKFNFTNDSANKNGNYNLKEDEKQILYSLAITEQEHENIENENLNTSQEKTLKDIRNLNDYLKEKYPSYSCTIERISFQGLLTFDAIYNFSVKGFSGTYKASQGENNEFIDDFYGEIYSSDYSNMIKYKVEDNNVDVIAIDTNFTVRTGNETKEGLTISELCDLKLACHVKIYVNSNSNYVLEDVKDIVKGMGLYGSYTVYNSKLFKSGKNVSECWDIWLNNKSDVEYKTFNSWE